ncbi:MAG TPA: sulfatase [Gemmataceae bacterium]|nr:sulfatase [Gemmataceae bacterium]
MRSCCAIFVLSLSLVAAGSIRADPLWRGLETTPQQSTPNIVFILIDDMGWKDLGCFGSKFYETPNCDKLAAQGMRFTNAYAACPVCSPTRASILTGKYPARLHLTDFIPGGPYKPSQKLLRPQWIQYLPSEETTLADALKPLGYTSASIGKWHLGGKPYYPEKHGFDLNIAGNEWGQPPSYFYPYKKGPNGASIPGLEEGKEGEYLTDRLTDEAEKFMEKNRDRPFFLYFAHYAVHIPLQAKKDVIDRYAKKAKADDPQNNPIYAAMVESVDDSVGRLLKKLDDLKIADRTIVIFFSDNGGLSVHEGPDTPSTSNAPLRAGKGYLYEGGVREPMIVRWPGVVQPGGVCDTPVCSIDFYPTILEMAGASIDPKRTADGVSLTPLLRGTGEVKRDALYWHYPHYSNQGGKPGAAVRQGDFKLIEFYEDDKVELYNLKDDVGETNDLAEKMPDKTKELHKLLQDWRIAADAQMMTPNPDYKREK